MPGHYELLPLLRDENCLSVTELARRLDVRPEIIPEWINTLKLAGVPVVENSTQGYRLHDGVILLNEKEIVSNLEIAARSHLVSIQVEQSVDSTSRTLARRAESMPLHGAVTIAESQHAGRGRRDNVWIASPYRNLMLSLGWSFKNRPADFSALGLAVGIMIVGAMRDLGIADLKLKWPNDIQSQGQKLGGILIEVVPGLESHILVIVGIGINVHIVPKDGMLIHQPYTDLQAISGRRINRNVLAAKILSKLAEGMTVFEQSGFVPFRESWLAVDVLAGKAVTLELQQSDTLTQGTAIGINPAGALVVDIDGVGPREFYSGDVSVREQ